ncbi:hypothetical protein ACFW9U_26440 [Rhodococcus aetherivorans]|uniref:hypothetical protein n=1 Tax=Rhodococcus aetherivorans TaxID=191292 RepID=UPI00366ADA30
MPDLRIPSRRRGEAIPHLGDLDIVWLHLDGDGPVSEQRHCTRCQPHEVGVVDVGCRRRGAGPLLPAAGCVADRLPAEVLRWHPDRGWGTGVNLVWPPQVIDGVVGDSIDQAGPFTS